MSTQDYSQQVNAAFTSLRKGLRPFVEQEMKAVYKDRWLDECQRSGMKPDREGNYTWDVMALLKIITNAYCWRDVFAMEKRRGAKERGVFVTLLEWRHELKGHDDKDVPRHTAQDVIENVAHALRCVDAKDELRVVEELLLSIAPQPKPQPVEPDPQILQRIIPTQTSLQPEKPVVLPTIVDTAVVEVEPLKIGRTTDFWGAYNFDFADALNEEIWLLSSEIQKQIQPADTLTRTGVIGAQQAMIDGSLLAERGPLPWVPDLVGKEWLDESGIIIVGSAYAGFIREYSTRTATIPLNQYLAASSMQNFQNLFLRYVVRGDPSYYTPIQNLCSDLGSASRLSLVDLCRVSLVERGSGAERRADNSSSVAKKAPAVFEKYVESQQAAEWLWRRFAEGQIKCVLALGSTAEHGLLRMFSHHGMTITQDEEPYFVSPIAQGEWANEYADPRRNLGYWLNYETWWTVRGQVDGVERVWYVLPTYHPSIYRNYDADYKRTKAVLKMMQAHI